MENKDQLQNNSKQLRKSEFSEQFPSQNIKHRKYRSKTAKQPNNHLLNPAHACKRKN